MSQHIQSVDFADAMSLTGGKRRHLLLGNGFSIGVHQRFRYSSLFEVTGEISPQTYGLMKELGTENFEIALRMARCHEEMQQIRAGLVKAIARVHPYNSLTLSVEDNHIADLIGSGEIGSLFLGWHSPEDHARFARLAEEWTERRERADKPPIEVFLFKSSDCAVWRPNSPELAIAELADPGLSVG